MKYSLSLTLIACVLGSALNAAQTPLEERLTLKNHRFLTLNTVIRVNQIDDGFQRNGFSWVTACWEISLVKSLKPEVLINQKQRRVEDAPVLLSALTGKEQTLIRKYYPELF